MIRQGIMIWLVLMPMVILISSTGADLDWWQTTVVYQIYPRSFKDSNGDGVGDLRGIYDKLDYIKDLGVETIWVQPVYRSPMIDNGYDVISFKEIDPMFGNMEDMKKLINGTHDRGMKIILDIVPNHLSDQNEWFKLSEYRVDPYTDYFVWHDGKIINESYRTVSLITGCWTWSEKRKQYYLHTFHPQQPDLNYRNTKVRTEMESILRFWLDLGVDGFRIDAPAWLVEASHFKDEPPHPFSDDSRAYDPLTHIYTWHQPETFEILRQWRILMDEYKSKDGQTRILASEDPHSTSAQLLPYFGNETHPGVHIPFYYGLLRFSYLQNVTLLDGYIRGWVDSIPNGNLPNWMVESHDRPRAISRLGADGIDSINMINLLLPGLACVYYGSEIGLETSLIRPDQAQDAIVYPGYRDQSRGPMAWDDTKNAGFTTSSKPWLPVTPSYWRKNVKREMEESNSHLKIFKRLVALKKTPPVKYGNLLTYVITPWIYMFTRSTSSNDTIAVIINSGSESAEVCAKDFAQDLPDILTVHTGSLNSGFNSGDKFSISRGEGKKCAELRPKAGVVLSQNSGNSLTLCSYLIILTLIVGGKSLQ